MLKVKIELTNGRGIDRIIGATELPLKVMLAKKAYYHEGTMNDGTAVYRWRARTKRALVPKRIKG